MAHFKINKRNIVYGLVATVIVDKSKLNYCLSRGVKIVHFEEFSAAVTSNLDPVTVFSSLSFNAEEFIIIDDNTFIHTVDKFLEIKRIEWERRCALDITNKEDEDIIELVSMQQQQRSTWMKGSGIDAYDSTLELISIKESGKSVTIPFGLSNLDDLLGGGAMPGDLVVIGARPGMGKTTLALNMLLYRLSLGNKVLLNTLDMSYEKTILMLALLDMKLTIFDFNKGRLSQAQFKTLKQIVVGFKHNDKLIITKIRNASELQMKVELEQSDFVVIDYLQIMKGGHTMEGLETITSSMKDVSSRLGIITVCLSQVVRDVANRPNKQPTLSDFMYSSAIENNADIVFTLLRPEYYDMTVDEEGNDIRGLMIIDAVKVRSGETGDVEVGFRNGLVINEFKVHTDEVPF